MRVLVFAVFGSVRFDTRTQTVEPNSTRVSPSKPKLGLTRVWAGRQVARKARSHSLELGRSQGHLYSSCASSRRLQCNAMQCNRIVACGLGQFPTKRIGFGPTVRLEWAIALEARSLSWVEQSCLLLQFALDSNQLVARQRGEFCEPSRKFASPQQAFHREASFLGPDKISSWALGSGLWAFGFVGLLASAQPNAAKWGQHWPFGLQCCATTLQAPPKSVATKSQPIAIGLCVVSVSVSAVC